MPPDPSDSRSLPDPWTPQRAFLAGVNAVQEEFDERGLGEADLIVGVIIDESGYPNEVERLRLEVERLRAILAEAPDWGEQYLREMDERKRQGDRAHKWQTRAEELDAIVKAAEEHAQHHEGEAARLRAALEDKQRRCEPDGAGGFRWAAADLEAERDRYRAALESIAGLTDGMKREVIDFENALRWAKHYAREAMNGGEDA